MKALCLTLTLALLMASPVDAKTVKKNIKIASKVKSKMSTSSKGTKKRKPPQANGLMRDSKENISKILKHYNNNEGAEIVLIKKIANDHYKIDIKSKLGHCDGSKVRIVSNNLNFDLRNYDCD